MRQPDSITQKNWFPFMLGIIIGAITLWPMTYTQLNNNTSAVALGWGIFCSIAGIYLGAVTERKISKIALHLCGGVAIALALRIIVDCAIDPTDHNLWPFEFVGLMMVCLPSGLAGAWLGRKFLQKRN